MAQKHWTHGTDRTRYTVKLAEQALRIQRLLIAQKIDGLAGMVAMHAPALAEHPDGRVVLQQVHAALKQSQVALRQSRAALRSK
jgi:predicted naringenin-chalcone synthase